MAFQPLTSDTRTYEARIAASVAVAPGNLLTPNGSGEVTTVGLDTADQVSGIAIQKIASTDADYASIKQSVIIAIDDQQLLLADVENGTVTEAVEQTYVDLYSAAGVNVAASANDNFFVTKVVNATGGAFGLGQVIGRLNSNATYKNAVP